MTRKTTQSKSDLLKSATGRPERLTLAKSRDLIFENFMNNLRVLIALETISGVELSRKVGLKSGSRIFDLSYGRGNPTAEELIVICQYFKISIDDILNKKAVITFELLPKEQEDDKIKINERTNL